MLNSRMVVATAALAALAGGYRPAEAAEVKGVQAVLLHCWSADSRNKLKDVLDIQNRFAISSAPFLQIPDTDDRDKDGKTSEFVEPCSMTSDHTDRLGNIARLITDLATTPELHIIVFVGNLHDASPIIDLGSKFGQVWTKLILPTIPTGQAAGRPNIYFHIGSSLEDKYRTGAAETAFKAMAAGIPAADADAFQRLVSAKRFTFRRSAEGNKAGDPSVDVMIGKTAVTGIPITNESHGRSPVKTYKAWSNDGDFVYYNRTGKAEKFNCPKCTESPLTLADFKSATIATEGFGFCGARLTISFRGPHRVAV